MKTNIDENNNARSMLQKNHYISVFILKLFIKNLLFGWWQAYAIVSVKYVSKVLQFLSFVPHLNYINMLEP